MQPVIETQKLTRTFALGDLKVHALQDVDLMVDPGEFVAIMGSSGSGKSTLMNLLGCLDQPTAGSYRLDGRQVNGLTRTELAQIRNRKLGFVFQGFNLLPRTTALENVLLPLFYDCHSQHPNPRAAAIRALERVGLADRIGHTASQLSGGQQQRVAIARALVNEPSLILADEPSGNLDSRTSMEILALFQELNDDGVTIILVTHERDIATYTKRVVGLRDGRIVYDQPVTGRRLAAEDLAAGSLLEQSLEESFL